MFDGAPAEQFIAPATRTSLPSLHLSSFPPTTFLPFDPYDNHPSSLLPIQPDNLFYPLITQHSKDGGEDQGEEKKELAVNNGTLVSFNSSINFETNSTEDQRGQRELNIDDSWSNDEVIALLRIRSGMESWFPELTWDHVSRKLGELGYKKSADKCKDKFEDESRYFNNIKNYRFLSELEDHHHLYQGHPDHQEVVETTHQDLTLLGAPQDHAFVHKSAPKPQNCHGEISHGSKMMEEEEKSRDYHHDKRKRRRGRRFEMLKGICESIVNKLMAQQEEIHKKLMEDMMRREEEKLAREEAWKKQEMDKVNKELRLMEQEQAIAADRQASIIHFLNKYTNSFQGSIIGNGYIIINHKTKDPDPDHVSQSINPNPSVRDYNNNHHLDPAPPSSNVIPNHETSTSTINPSFSDTMMMLQVPSSPSNSSSAPHNPSNNSSSLNSSQDNPQCKAHEKLDDVGRRWPRDEVLALINLRCMSLKNNNNNNNNIEGNKQVPPPLWERISKGMAEMGYNRSAKRCKEKWENINKYFRKTKDNVNKKRSLDSRTCPYFHQLRTLYSTQGKLNPHVSFQNLLPDSPHVHQALPQSSSQAGFAGFGVHCDAHGDGGENNNNFDTINVAPLNFDD